MSISPFFTKTASSCYSPPMNIKGIEQRSALLQAMRHWFADNGYLEVSTPIIATHLIPEATIANFATTYISEFNASRELYLIPSPEVHMKPIIREIQRSIYQITSCFRNREQVGSYHNPEFTMLEYYTLGCDEQDSIAITEELIAKTALEGTPEHLLPPFKKMSMREACQTYGNFDLEKCPSTATLRAVADNLHLYTPPEGESWEALFNRIFLNVVEPNLPQDKPLILYDYPEQIECLAQKSKQGPYRQRWELYAGGIELANCYNEERDAVVVKAFYEKQYALLIAQRANTGEVIPDIDPSFPQIFDQDFPQCSGVALGLDRLLMLQGGYKKIEDLILFPLSAMLRSGN